MLTTVYGTAVYIRSSLLRIHITSHHPAGQMVKSNSSSRVLKRESGYSNFEAFQRLKTSEFVYSIIRFMMNAFAWICPNNYLDKNTIWRLDWAGNKKRVTNSDNMAGKFSMPENINCMIISREISHPGALMNHFSSLSERGKYCWYTCLRSSMSVCR